MIQEVASWSKDNIPGLIGRKKVDWSIVEHGETVIPLDFHHNFYEANAGAVINRGKREEVSLVINGKKYKAFLRNADRKVESDTLLITFGKDLKDLVKEAFHSSYEYFTKNPKSKIPDEIAEFIEFYRTEEPYKYRLSLITNESKKLVRLSDKEMVDHIYNYIKTKGFYYEKEEVINLFLSLKTKPFVILSGISGTGKTMMIKWFAESLGATKENGQFTLIPVRPDWSDGSDLLGYRDIKGEFILGPVTVTLKRAADNSNKPYFILLDEMNLARVEYYFSDFLSVMESREWRDGKLVTHKVLPEELMGEKVGVPDNVYIIGTVNMDETTFPFSKKVLDRANTIEFNRVVLDNFSFLENTSVVENISINNSNIMGGFLHLKDAFQENSDLIRYISNELMKINNILERIGAHVGYRVRDEICFYIIYNNKEKLLKFNNAFDNQIFQKILPRISGSDYRVFNVLQELYTFCTGNNISDENIEEVLREVDGAKYVRSAKKLGEMIRKYNEGEFTSFWL
ncbi:McrB family protein [Neobacillus niacini]|uniref:McrB family protein n=1 Tax=Neobacillus niacini TaxID=86668 RepID=UPI0037C79247